MRGSARLEMQCFKKCSLRCLESIPSAAKSRESMGPGYGTAEAVPFPNPFLKRAVVKLRSDQGKMKRHWIYVQWRPVASNQSPVPALPSLQSGSKIELEGELQLSRRLTGQEASNLPELSAIETGDWYTPRRSVRRVKRLEAEL